MKLTNDALIFATNAHSGQTRKVSGLPYIVHPVAVAETVHDVFKLHENSSVIKRKNIDIERAVAAAYLHDTVEDCGVLISEIETLFGVQIATLVYELTELTSEINPELVAKMKRQEKWLLNKTKIKNMSFYSAVIKLADRLDNSSIFVEGALSWAEKYYGETQELLQILTSKYGGSEVIDDLANRIREKLAVFETRVKEANR